MQTQLLLHVDAAMQRVRQWMESIAQSIQSAQDSPDLARLMAADGKDPVATGACTRLH